jgi:beta-N-acetylhexosaminidase
MTLRQKINQLFMIDMKETKVTPSVQMLLRKGEFGNVILFRKNLVNADQCKVLIRQLGNKTMTRTGIPMLIAVDQEGGSVDRLSQITANPLLKHSARRIGKLFRYSPKRASRVIRSIAHEVGKEMQDLGFNMNLAPVLDLAKSRNSYIYNRSFDHDPEKVSAISRIMAREFSRIDILTTGKHFPNLSQTQIDSHSGLPFLNRSLKQLENYEFRPFANLRSNVDAMMMGHVIVPAIDKLHPTSISPKAVSILRNQLKFDGIIMTDDIKISALSAHYSHQEIAVRAIAAGVDMVIMA